MSEPTKEEMAYADKQAAYHELERRLNDIRSELNYIGMTACILYAPDFEETQRGPWSATVMVEEESDLWSVGVGESPESAVQRAIEGIMKLCDEE